MGDLAGISLTTPLMRLALVALAGIPVAEVTREGEPGPARDGADQTPGVPPAERDPATVLRLAAGLGALTLEAGR